MEMRKQAQLEAPAEGGGVERVAELYVIDGLTIDAKPAPSREFLEEVERSKSPADLQELVKAILMKGLRVVVKEQR
jgi:hypothetical protein